MMSLTKIAKVISQLANRMEELERRQANLMRPGVVTEVDLEHALVKVKAGNLPSAWLPWMELAGSIKSWGPPAVGQQVHLFSPSGEPGQGWVLPGGFSDTNPQGHNKAGEYKLSASRIILAADEIILDGKVHVTGDELTHRDKNVGDNHKHMGVIPGGGITDVPV